MRQLNLVLTPVALAAMPTSLMAAECVPEFASADQSVVVSGVEIAPGTRMQVDVPVVVRLAGTNVEEGQKILAKSGLPVIRAGTLMEAAERVVSAWRKDQSENTNVRAAQ